MRRRLLEFEVGDQVFLKVSPTIGVSRSLKIKKSCSKYVGPFQILSKAGLVAHKLALPPNLSQIHNVFYVSQLKKYYPDPTHFINHDDNVVRDNLPFEVGPERIIDRKDKN
ncbi:uncharacterized protein LOC114755952 [Neltuma alba]|uniref:uncharacterized protein LOC114755952 n=1 Tax=Neltuma alba TaxID=207710 RepID=UPI0010A56DA7|nr:uncharacterized protein LOC114755952 [Prosopis alba]